MLVAAARSLERMAATGASRRVTHVVWEYGRPSETFVADTIGNLDALGWTGSVVTGGAINREWFPFPPDDRLHIARRPSTARRMLGRLRRQAAVERGAAWYTPGILATRPAIVHAHFGWAAPFAAPAARRLGVPLAVTFHATDVTVWPQDPGNRAAYGRLFPHIALAMAVSRFTEGKLREAGFDGPVEIEPAGVDLTELPFRGPRDGGAAETRVLFIGRLVPRKGLDVLLAALARLGRESVRLTVVGDGPLRAESEALAGELGLGAQVKFLGALPQAGVRRALAEADVLVLPSRTTDEGEAEGSPTVLKEALAVGLAVVATDNGGTVEVLPPELRHEIVPEDDADGLAARLGAVLDAHATWTDRATLGRRWVEEEFDASALARRLAARYEEALEARR
jgi:colanic acid/amylovoran biosynthesis glycosyltransferase